MTYISSQNSAPVSVRRFSPRPVPEVFTAQQRDFLAAVPGTRSHLYLRATAGAGKTTTLVEAAWHLPVRDGAQFFVYNRDAVGGMADRLPSGIRASTFHAHGRSVLIRARNGQDLRIDRGRTGRLVEVFNARGGMNLTGLEARALCRVWDQAREALLSVDSADDDLVALAVSADCAWLRGSEHARAFLRLMHGISTEDFSGGGDPDFTDLLWLPLQLGLERGSVRVGLVDEGQDLTPLRQGFALHLIGLGGEGEGRLILAADPDQSIYQYAGARPEGLMRLVSDIGAVTFPLSVSFRCPRSHVRLARRVSTFIEPSPAAALGRVEHALASSVQYLPGETVLCRTNAPLIRLALELLAQGVKVNLRDNTVSAWLESAAQAVFDVPVPLEQLEERLAAYEAWRTAPYEEAVQDGDRQAKLAVRRISDLCDCLRALAERAGRRAGRVMAQAVTSELRRLFGPAGDVLLTTVHGAKGLEWQRVTILYPERLRLESGDPHEEDAVTFVALTRCRDRLRFAYGEAAFEGQAWAFWEPGPGVYAQVGSRMVLSQGEAGQDVRVSSLKVSDPMRFDARRNEVQAARPALERTTRDRTALTSQADWLGVVQRSFAGEHKRVLDPDSGRVLSRTVPVEVFSPGVPLPATLGELRLLCERREQERRERHAKSLAFQALTHPLFQGDDVSGTPELRCSLQLLVQNPRPALSAFALAALAQLIRHRAAEVRIDEALLDRITLAASQADALRTVVQGPVKTPKRGKKSQRRFVLVWKGDGFVLEDGGNTVARGAAVSLTVGGELLTFDADSGEVAGTTFDPFRTHLMVP